MLGMYEDSMDSDTTALYILCCVVLFHCTVKVLFFVHSGHCRFSFFFFFNDPAPTEIYPLPLHDPLPIYQPEVAPPAAVGADPEPLAARVESVVDVVLVVLLARQDHPPLAERLGGGQPAILAGGERAGGGKDHVAASRAEDAQPEQLLRLLEQEIVGGGAAARPQRRQREHGL